MSAERAAEPIEPAQSAASPPTPQNPPSPPGPRPAPSSGRSRCWPRSAPRTSPRWPPPPAEPVCRPAPRCGCCARWSASTSSSATKPPGARARDCSSSRSAPWLASRSPALARPALARLTAVTGESAYLSVRGAEGLAVHVAAGEGTFPVRYAAWVGHTLPLDGTAVGAALDDQVEACGYASGHPVGEPDVTQVAAPIRRPRRRGRGAERHRPGVPDGRGDGRTARRGGRRRGPAARGRAGGRRSRARCGLGPAVPRAAGPAGAAGATGGQLSRTATRAAGPRKGGVRVIRFDQVGKKYPDGTVAVDVLASRRRPGRSRCCVGPSGCGKTTSLRMINRMIEPTSGRIWLDDQDTAQVNRPSCAAASATSSSTPGCSRTARSSTTSRPSRCCSAGTRSRPGPRAMELMERVGLPAEFGQALPGPALRRPAAAGRRRPRAGRRPAGDADGRAVQRGRPGGARPSCRTSSSGCSRELGKTIVFVTHDIDEAVKLGDQVAVMRVGGKLAQLATPGRAARRPRPTTSWPASSAATAATARSASTRPATCRWPTSPPSRSAPSRPRTARAARRRLGARGRRRQAPAGLGRRSAAVAGPDATVEQASCCTAAGRWPTGGRLAAGGARRRAVLAVRPRRDRRRRRPAARHDHRRRGGRADRGRRSAGRRRTTAAAVRAPRRRGPSTDRLPAGPLPADRRLVLHPRLARGAAAWSSGWCWRSRWAGWPAATGGSTRRVINDRRPALHASRRWRCS